VPVSGHGLRREVPSRSLYLVVSAAAAAEGAPGLVTACQAAGWRVTVFATPAGVGFVDSAELERLTGGPVRSEYRKPGTGTPVPPADAVLACPLTFNSVNKFAHGHADNFAVALLCEMAGYGVPVLVVPACKPQLATHPAFAASLVTLRSMGVRVLFDPDAPDGRLPDWPQVVAALPQPASRGR
jgi:phosphopantothenoylcysteine synthetase/decarboxylase